MALRNVCLLLFHSAKNMKLSMSVFITLSAPDDPANSNKFLFFCTSQSVYKD